MIQKIVNKIKLLPDKIVEDKSKEYSHLKTISAISRFCYGIKKLKAYLENGKYQKFKISEDDIINTVFDMLFKEEEKKPEISDSIKNALLRELIEEKKKKWKVKTEINMRNIFLKTQILYKILFYLFIYLH
jgi:hypothetical protein